MKQKTPIRQGDVLLVPVEKLPEGKITKHTELTLAFGEATGHHHTLYPAPHGLIAFETENFPCHDSIEEVIINGKRFIKLDTEWLLRHQEHKELRIPPATYEIIIEREYDPFEEVLKKVVD